jgi:hypothetical protein
LEDDEASLKNKELRKRFQILKDQMKAITISNKETSQKIQIYDLLFKTQKMIDT